MRVLRLTEKDYKIGVWSGGSTTELFIWPKDADYSKREFAVRVSSARVDLEESDFTALPNVTRYITPLSGGFTLTHPNANPVTMKPLSVPYRFSGETPTHCVGKATDFNLMLKGTDGEMAICDDVWQLKIGFNCIYAVYDMTVNLENTYNLNAGELLVVFTDVDCSAVINARAIACFAKI